MNSRPEQPAAPRSGSPISFLSGLAASAVLVVLGFVLGQKFGFSVFAALGIGIYLYRADEKWRDIGKGILAAALTAFVYYFAWPVFYISIPGLIIATIMHKPL